MSIRPTFMGFETAARGLMINQKSLDIIANNLGNVNTTGYTRQRVDQMSMALNYRNTRFHTKTALAGQGAKITGVSQMRDPFLDKRFREEYADVAYYDSMASILTDVSAALDEVTPSPISEALSKLQSAWGEMFKEGGNDSVAASGVLAASRTLSQVFQQLDSKLNNVREQQRYNLDINVTTLNTTLQKVADLNDAIKKEYYALDYAGGGTYGPNELLDERNVLLDQLAGFGDIEIKSMTDGTVEVKMAGHTVVKGDEYDILRLSSDPADKTVQLNWNSNGEGLNLGSGSLKASYEMLNGRGVKASVARGETFDQGIPFYKDKIDQFAVTMANAFNTIIENKYTGGLPQPEPNRYKTLFTFKDPTSKGAGGLIINPEWSANASYMFTDIERDGVKDTAYVDRANAIFTREDLDFGDYTGSVNGYITFYTTQTLGSQIEYSTKRLSACSDVSDDLLKRIASVSGVMKDEEAAHAMQFQKAYEAMSRVMTVLDDLLDVLINSTGRAGL